MIKKLYPVIVELFIRGRKLNISLVFILQSYFALPKNVCFTHYYVKIQTNENFNKLHLIIHQILTLETMNLYKKCTAKPYSFLVTDATLALDDPSRFRKNLLERI